MKIDRRYITAGLLTSLGMLFLYTKYFWIPVAYCLSDQGVSGEICRLTQIVNGNIALDGLLLLPILLYGLYGFLQDLPGDEERISGLNKLFKLFWPPVVAWLGGILWFRPLVMFAANTPSVVRALDWSFVMLTLSLMMIGLIGGLTLKQFVNYIRVRTMLKSWFYGLILLGIYTSVFAGPFIGTDSWYYDFISTMGFWIFPLILFIGLVLDRNTIWWKKFLWLGVMMFISTLMEYAGFKIGNPWSYLDGHRVDNYTYDGIYSLVMSVQGMLAIILGTLLFVVFRAKHPVKRS